MQIRLRDLPSAFQNDFDRLEIQRLGGVEDHLPAKLNFPRLVLIAMENNEFRIRAVGLALALKNVRIR